MTQPPVSEVSRTRLAIVGPSGSGKTTSILHLMRHLIPKGARFVFVEGDDGLSKCLDEYPDIKALKGSSWFVEPVVTDWGKFWGRGQGVGKVLDWVNQKLLGPNDYVVTEGLDIITTDMIRGEWVDRVTVGLVRGAQSSWDASISQGQKGHPIIDQGGWGAINGEIEKALSYLAFQMPCNWIATTDIEPIRDGDRGDDQVLKDLYRNMGMDVKLTGYKWLPRYFDTIVRTGRGLTTGYNFAVYKNRGQRAHVAGNGTTGVISFAANQDFYVDFAMKYLGWPE